MAEPIAIVGTACRFPGSASSPSKLWQLLETPRDVLGEYPPERMNFHNFYSEDGEAHGRTDVRNRAYLLDEDVRHFDAAFFRINPKEAAGMDPQQRILLETVYEAFEAAGWTLDAVGGSQTSVHVGVMTDDWYLIQGRDAETMGSHAATGLSRSLLSNRISYAFDLKGPSMTVDTACSSSLVALNLAVQGIRKGEASQAIVAGTNLLMDPHWFITESSLHMLSPDSRSRMWDKDAKGYARGEGCAAVVLKSLSQAIKDGDHIECIIRETAVNQDGRTNGVTMPSPVAQAALIRQTYENAGLDIFADRCQYFECHGTGTQAGDPVESRAIRDAFFPESRNNSSNGSATPLYCGSIKTVLGHLEGCAGLAGLLKASLAIQNKIIPPNLLFNELNPSVEPFYKNLHVPTRAIPWPETHGQPRRASVNSFGFGGTNAHAIIESYEPSPPPPKFGLWNAISEKSASTKIVEKPLIGPFLFSARSRPALANSLKQVLEYIHVNTALDLDALSSILQSKRTAFSHRIAVSAVASRRELEKSLEEQIRVASTSTSFGIRALNNDEPSRILGIFTGQGAQAAQMGRQLLEHSHLFRESIQRCQEALELLPEAPVWSIEEELNRDDADSRISQAVFSQPLCTAIQIALVDLLLASGVKFAAVVGHSSGEIGAAYAAGVLSLRDAMGIAYYRGHVAHLAKGPGGKQGSMMAAALSFADATSLCAEPRFSGRISVAASNAPASVTLSGDIDAINEMKAYLDKKQTQARQLRVDTAYHSHHMHRCAETYLAHLKQLNIHLQKPRPDCVWSSSVQRNTDMLRGSLDEQLRGQYWVDNMVNAVLFSEAVRYAVESNPLGFAFGLEVGPHPALKGPVGQTLKSLRPSPLPYTGCLERGKPGIETASEALGLLWSYLGPSAVDFAGWRKAFGLSEQVKMIKDLPCYPWDHDQIHWRESRISHNYRLGTHLPQSLLGRLHEDSQYEQTWRNILHLREIPWVKGHTFQGQILFPGAGYISLAVDAAKAFVKGRPIKFIEAMDVNIPKALTITEDNGVEILFTIRSNVRPTTAQDVLEAEFVCYSCPDERVLDKTCDGKLVIHLGEAAPGDLPPSQMSQSELTPLSEDRFQRAVSETGLGYDGVFRALQSISRTWGHAKAAASWDKGDLDIGCTVHPALLDVAFQVGLATFISNAEKALGSSYLPVGIRRAIVDPNQDYRDALGGTGINIESRMSTSDKTAVEVDINVYPKSGHHQGCGIQIDGLILKALSEPQASDDRQIFVKTIWDVDVGSGIPTPSPIHGNTEESIGLTDAIERTALYYLQNVHRDVRPEELASAKWYHKELHRVIGELLAPVRESRHPILQEEWLDDELETIKQLREQYPNSVDIEAITVVGENLPSVIRGESEMLEAMTQNDLLTRLYKDSYPLSVCNQHIAQIMRQISHKYPRTRILEIGAGTGATTLSVMNAIGDAYLSYTCTDISSSFFSGLAERLPQSHASRVDFKKFNVELGPSDQGFVEGSYDIVIAANVLHATSSLTRTLNNTRSLLRPGGFLIAMEVTGPTLFQTALMGGLEGWWLGVDEGRTSGPGISPKEWDDVLGDTGFSGVDCIVHDHVEFDRHSCSVFVSQAVNDRINLLRNPLDSLVEIPKSPIMILGGKTLAVSKMARRVVKTLDQWMFDVTTCSGIDELRTSKMAPGSVVLYLGDLDKAFWSEKPSAKRLENLQEMLGAASKILWVTSGRRLSDPYSNVMVGIGRALAVELPHLTMHFLDFDSQSYDVDTVTQQLLRLCITSSSEAEENSGILWVTEPEVVVAGNQKLVPRVIQDNVANEALNAKRRTVSKNAEPTEAIELVYPVDSTTPTLLKSSSMLVSKNHHVAINIEMSLALHDKQEKPCFLCFGRVEDSDDVAFALSDVEASTVSVHVDGIFRPTNRQAINAETLVSMASYIIASQVLSSLSSHGRTLVYDAPGEIAQAISAIAVKHDRQVAFIKTSSALPTEELDCIVVHPHASARSIQALIPRDTAALLSFSREGIDVITKGLQKHCIINDFNPALMPQLPAIASLAMAFEASSTLPKPSPTIMNIRDVPDKLLSSRERLSTVIDWKRDGPIASILEPLQAHKIFFPNKTYFLVGMAGELGQSLCRFMVKGGARHIVLASRNPKEDSHWILDLRSTGADIRIVKMDVTDKKQVQKTVAMLRKTMPQIGGVTNAALVFDAGIFVNYSAENVESQLKPKIDGTIYLDQEFANDKLDFFLTFGSLATVCGNPGQTMYHAGNMFMTSMVEKRRSRGLAATVLHFGLMVDVGYVTRTDRSDGTNIEERLRNFLLTPLAETEFHHLVLQGIMSGRPETPSGEVIMGMAPYIDDGTTARPKWVDKPFFSHMIHTPTESQGRLQSDESAESMQQLHENLDKASNVGEAVEAVKELFYKKIEMMINVPRNSIDASGPLADLGLDSLNGIDIRKWLMKEFQINMPLLRILGRESMTSLCTSVAKKYMENKGHQPSSSSQEEPAPVPRSAAKSAVPQTGERSAVLHVNTAATKAKLMPAPQIHDSHEAAHDSDSEASTASIDTPLGSHAGTPIIDSKIPDTGATTRVASPSSNDSPSSFAKMRLPSPCESPALHYTRIERASFAQAGVHFMHTYLEDQTSFNVTLQYSIKGQLNANRLARAVEKALSHHDAYRTCFFPDPGSPQLKQHVASNIDLRRLTHITTPQAGTADETVQSAWEAITTRDWKLSLGDTFHAVLITHGPDSHTIVFGFHLIASDAFSFSVFLRDLDRAYQMLPLSKNATSYLDFTRYQFEDLHKGRLEDSIEYWKAQLDPIPTLFPLLPLAKVKNRQARRILGNHVVEKELGAEMVRRVREVSQAHGGTSMQFYLATFQILLARLADIDDVCIGVTDSGRGGRNGDFADSVGHFANILPMRFRIRPDQSFAELIGRTSRTVLEAFDNAQVPFDVLLERLGIERSPVHTPLFQVAFNYRIGDLLQRPLGSCKMVIERHLDVKTAHDLTINVTQTADQGHLIEVITSDQLYSLSATSFIAETYASLVESLIHDQSVKVESCKLYSDTQVERAIALGKGSTMDHPWPKTLPRRFQQVYSTVPNSVAIKDAEGQMTYGELARKMDLYATAILDHGAVAGSRVAVLCEPSIDTYAIMLAILRIGAVYVPLDVKLPATRHRAMLDACKPELLVFHAPTTDAAVECYSNNNSDDSIRTLNISGWHATRRSNSLPPMPTTDDGDSFLLFTSGSTGTPKGIRLGQSGIMNYAASKSAMLGLGQIKVLQQTSTGFDMAIAQVFNAFANGGTLVVAPSKSRGDPAMISQIILREGIEFTLATPSEYMMWATYAADALRQCTSWRHACSGGEVVSDRLLAALQRLELPGLTLTDCYGPTEVSCATTFRRHQVHVGVETVSNGIAQDNAASSVGKAIPNTSIYILGDDGSTVLPVGMPGEICVGGSGVARGYLDAHLSSMKFVHNPFATPQDLAKGWSTTMYKTGDRGLLQADGSLTFLGRTDGGDTLVKLRGLRIDLEEVAEAILQAAAPDNALADAAVTVRGEPQYLVAHVAVAPGKHLDQAQLNSILQDLGLPRYMIPSVIVALPRLPTTPNGKVDRRALQALQLPVQTRHEKVDTNGDRQLTVPEGELRVIWLEILGDALGANNIRADSDFFTVGGSSLLLVRLQASLRERTGVALSLQELYQATTLKKMATLMSEGRGQLSDEAIDWDAETSIPAGILETARNIVGSPSPKRQHRQILLTGATTFLGGEILLKLVENDEISKIHCIAVGDDDRHKLPSKDEGKVVVYSGSLLNNNLGLSSKEMKFLQENVDQIVHAAVQGHCMNNYTSVKQALYMSTQALANLALPRRIPFHLISVPRVVLLSGQFESQPVTMSGHKPPTDGSQGVTASKWASEVFLESLSRETGLPVAIHRHCALIGDRAPADDVFNSVILYSVLSHKVPDVSTALGFFDFKDVEAVASEMAGEPPATAGPVIYRHHSSDVRVKFSKLAEHMEQFYGGKFETVSPAEWIAAAKENGLGELLQIHLKANMESGKPLMFPYLGKL